AESGEGSCVTLHLAKGLVFRTEVVMARDDEVIPLQERIETATDEGELEEVYATERHLLYVACTRARDHLLVTGVEPASEFLADLRPEGPTKGDANAALGESGDHTRADHPRATLGQDSRRDKDLGDPG